MILNILDVLILIICFWVVYDLCLDLEVKWIPKSDRLISVTGYEDQVIDPKIREAILHEDSTAAEVLMPL